jgi:NADPH:quinone reductase-like Zn-dependent oxidoreductase
MKAIRIKHPASLETLMLTSAEEQAPQRGEIKVRIRAASVNFRDMLVATGFFPTRDGLIPLSDGRQDWHRYLTLT